MNTRAESLSWNPAVGWWVVMGCVISAGLLTRNWFIAAGVLAFLLIQIFRPFDFIATYLLVVAGSTFIYYEGGNLTLQLSLLTVAFVLMMISYALTERGGSFALPWNNLGCALLAYVAVSLAGFVHGALSGNPMRFALIELYAVLGIATTFLVFNRFDAKRDMRLIVALMTGVAFGSASLGFWVFAIIHTHTSGVYFNTIPGIMALFYINLALRAKSVQAALAWTFLALPLFLHQFLSFRRGLWIGCIAGLIVNALVLAIRRGRDPWRRVGLVFGTLALVGAMGAVSLEIFYGRADILSSSLGRFASIGATDLKSDTKANVIRLIEAAVVAGHIKESPLIGHGLGYTFVQTSNAVQGHSEPQFQVDNNYLMFWLKIGLIGLLVYVWLLWAVFRFAVHHARDRADPWEASWFATMAACAVFLTLFSVSDWPMYQVNPTFLLALIFGGAMAMTRRSELRLRWSVPRGSR